VSRCRNRRGDETPPKQALPRDAQLGLNHRTFIDPNDETNRWQDEKAATAVAVLDRPGSRGPGPRRSCGLRAEPLWADEPADTPGSVPARGCPRAGGGHPSTTYVAARLQRPTRELGRAALERSLSGLAPGGVCRAAPVTRRAGGLLHHRFTLTGPPRGSGGLFSVALSRGSPRVGVAHHPALRSPDVPRRVQAPDATAWLAHPRRPG